MILRAEGIQDWAGVDVTTYKNEPGTWMDVSRRVLFSSDASGFEVRYFHIDPGGYSSFEKHEHEHCVIVLNGSGEVRLGSETQQILSRDTVIVPSWTPHQFRAGDAGMGILCIVDRDRDRPVPLDEHGNVAAGTAS